MHALFLKGGLHSVDTVYKNVFSYFLQNSEEDYNLCLNKTVRYTLRILIDLFLVELISFIVNVFHYSYIDSGRFMIRGGGTLFWDPIRSPK